MEHIKNEALTLTFETSFFEDFFEAKLQPKSDKYYQSLEQPEEELVGVIEQQHKESKYTEEELVTIN